MTYATIPTCRGYFPAASPTYLLLIEEGREISHYYFLFRYRKISAGKASISPLPPCRFFDIPARLRLRRAMTSEALCATTAVRLRSAARPGAYRHTGSQRYGPNNGVS